jgi:glucose/arabinose dehydrogenase
MNHEPGVRLLPVPPTLAASILVLLLGGCGGDGGTPTSSVPTPTPAPACPYAPVPGIPVLTAHRIVSGLDLPLDLQSVPDDHERLYVVEQGGRIRVIRNGKLQAAPFLDISDRIQANGERGLLGLAFHPQFAENGRFFVNFTQAVGGATVIAEFRATSRDTADAASRRGLLVVPQPYANHNGGGLAFGNDGFLYVALGDGGSGGDPRGNGQSLETPLGKILRIDVDSAAPYAVPASNPFVSTPGAVPEIWAYGLRNPFRFSFERSTGTLYIGDVGQGAREEIDVGLASQGGGENYGWNVTEGTACYRPPTGCDATGITMPVLDYTHADGCAVTGGYVYEGCRMPDLVGTYFYGDYCSGFVRSFRYAAGQVTQKRDWTSGLAGIDHITSFGTDADGEIYVVDRDGEVYRLEPAG